MKFKDKVAIITGSAKGIGRGTALAFAGEGANIAINYRNSKDAAEEAAREQAEAAAAAAENDDQGGDAPSEEEN